METIKINPPKGHQVKYDQEKGEITFEETPKDITELINSVDDAIDYLGEDDPEVIIYKKMLHTFSDDPDNHLLNYQTAVVLVRAINEKWEPDWADSSEYKYSIYFVMSSSGFRYDDFDDWVTFSAVGSRLCFKNLDLGKLLINRFLPVFKQFMTIQK